MLGMDKLARTKQYLREQTYWDKIMLWKTYLLGEGGRPRRAEKGKTGRGMAGCYMAGQEIQDMLKQGRTRGDKSC